LEQKIEDKSHPVWRIEEYTRIFLIKIWLIAPKAPTKHLVIIINLIKLFLIYRIKIIGAIFCQVKISKIWIHLAVWITWGSQKWKGAAPIFRERTKRIIILIIKIEFVELKLNIRIEEKISSIEARAWAIKYLIEVSEE